ncbi:hypothetical protein FHW36_111143 [Chitinophaga polysaccharea]|uniref:Uncharacterized protein n=1 Tax=Chitinophaga polysaccharea TaxID=1293035 RepID=A0A561P756_9BACT|nr:hypothetical protein [Chitinophaga polysaccharea]TWF33952.1 hypothetical protein FHW36_111143 [Chitinophaga polysaccharea]
MIQIILSFFLALLSPNHSNNGHHNNDPQVTVLDDTGGETGTIPPRKP